VEILCRVHSLLSGGTSVAFIAFMWVSSHVGLAGNLVVDIAADVALLLLDCSSFGLQLSHM